MSRHYSSLMKSLMKKSKLNKNSISIRVESIDYSVIRKAFSAGRGKNMINLTIGQPDFDVPKPVKEAAKRHVDLGHNKYTETKGVLELRQEISAYLAREKDVKRSAEEIIVTPGTTAGIFLIMLAMINPGDEVIVFAPYFVAYSEIIKLASGKMILVPTDKNFQPDIKALERAISTKTKLIIVNSPNNPTGALYSENKLAEIAHIAKKHGIYLMSDEVYSQFVYGSNFFSPAKVYEKTIVVDGLSKTSGMTGWRIGFVVGPTEIIAAVEKIQQFTAVCAPSAFQYAAIEALRQGLSPEILSRYKRARDKIYEGIKDYYGTIKPGGAFYFFIKTSESAEEFTERLLKSGLAVVPGTAFGKFKNYIRISYATSEDKINSAIKILRDTAIAVKR